MPHFAAQTYPHFYSLQFLSITQILQNGRTNSMVTIRSNQNVFILLFTSILPGIVGAFSLSGCYCLLEYIYPDFRLWEFRINFQILARGFNPSGWYSYLQDNLIPIFFHIYINQTQPKYHDN